MAGLELQPDILFFDKIKIWTHQPSCSATAAGVK
jgi:hypothetical protein